MEDGAGELQLIDRSMIRPPPRVGSFGVSPSTGISAAANMHLANDIRRFFSSHRFKARYSASLCASMFLSLVVTKMSSK